MRNYNEAGFRKQISVAAHKWVGTPYQHQASMRGRGCDCLGLIRGVWREVIGPEPEIRPTYTPNWDQKNGDDLLLNALETYFQRVEINEFQVGDIVAFKLRRTGLIKHVGIIVEARSSGAMMIHSYSNRGVVVGPLGMSWRRRCVGQFQFPRRIDEWQRYF